MAAIPNCSFYRKGLRLVVQLTMLAGAAGCGFQPNGTPDPPERPTSSSGIVNFLADFSVSVLQENVSVVYTVEEEADQVRGFYVPMAQTSQGFVPAGERVIVAPNLSAGRNRVFNFNVHSAGVGHYRVGILVTTGVKERDYLSRGVIRVLASPRPVFIQPHDEVTEVAHGTRVIVAFDAGDPEGRARWRLFYLGPYQQRNLPLDRLGVQLKVGSGNTGQFELNTSLLSPGDYELGLSVTNIGRSVADTVARGLTDLIVTIPNETQRGPVIRIVESRQVLPPTVAILAPGAQEVVLFRNEAFTVHFAATVSEPGVEGLVDVFYDLDRNPLNGVTIIAGDLPHETQTVPFPTDLQEGSYYVGATIYDGIGAPVTTYAIGRIKVVRTVTLTVTAPDTDVPHKPSLPDQAPRTVPVNWKTNAPPQAGVVEVFAQRLDRNGQSTGLEIPVLPASSLDITSAAFSSEQSGLFEISVRLSLADGSTVVRSAPRPVRVSSLPRFLWLGSLADVDPPFEGAIFEGIDAEDNAGACLTTAGDLNGDGLADFVIGARYAKPFVRHDSGIGPGEAYLIYGAKGTDKPSGTFGLGSVGGEDLPGVTVIGIPTFADTDDTDGLSCITLIPDADGDTRGELAFGFPRTNSAASYLLEADGQFLRGGVVILSSSNPMFASPTKYNPVIELADVGQLFNDMTVEPMNEDDILEDQLRFERGGPGEEPVGCTAGSDGVPDTIVGPGFGFVPALAPPRHAQLGFIPFGPNTPMREGVCPTEYSSPVCEPSWSGAENPFSADVPGSGFYGAGARALQPFGARILGITEGDGFGSWIAFSRASLAGTAAWDLIITAPHRTARKSGFKFGTLQEDIHDSGVAFLARNRILWGRDARFGDGLAPPTPHQYMIDTPSHCDEDRAPPLEAHRLAGNSSEHIENVIGIPDFNGDGRDDLAFGVPRALSGRGRVYVLFRRDATIERDVPLGRLELDRTDPDRVSGLLITTMTVDGLGASIASGVDFNADGISDLVIGSPDAGDGTGEVIVVFGQSSFGTDRDGITVDELLRATRNISGARVAARIKGSEQAPEGRFGFNVANAGDVDGDGFADLLVAAPGASPRFDQDPTDTVDELNADGLDLDFDGRQDDVSGPYGLPDGRIDSRDNLEAAGLVYVISGRSRLDLLRTSDATIGIDALGGDLLPGFIVVGRHAGDRLGGGDAGNLQEGGNMRKLGRGRSRGLAAAGDVNGDKLADILIGAILADPRRDAQTASSITNAGEAYLVYGFANP